MEFFICFCFVSCLQIKKSLLLWRLRKENICRKKKRKETGLCIKQNRKIRAEGALVDVSGDVSLEHGVDYRDDCDVTIS